VIPHQDILPFKTTTGRRRWMQITTFGGQSLNVRFGSKADIASIKRDVRFTPKSGHG
jgi:hypothetical protein